MFILDDQLIWSAGDLVAAAECEFALLRRVDHLLGWATAAPSDDDPLLAQVADLGHRHEAQALAAFEAELGAGVRRCAPVARFDRAGLDEAAEATARALAGDAAVLHQAAFFDGEFFGYADFLRATPDGWLVIDTKLARQAQPRALLQLAAYSDAASRAGAQVAPTVRLHLGDDRVADFPRDELEAVFRERRARLRALLTDHRSGGSPVAWDQPGVVQCGRCAECEAAAHAADDLLQVARLRIDQRRRLKDAGIDTMTQLAAAEAGPPDMAASTFERLRAQARIQVRGAAAGEVLFEVVSDAMLRALPAPSPGDLFFDFEGDPLFNEGDPNRWGLEYLWGVLTSPDHPTQPSKFLPLWADDHAAEKEQLVAFLDDLMVRLEAHPDLHVFHYAPYEVTALKRLAAVHETHEDVVDELLRRGVFVDLYAVVRESVLVSESSYSIKRLEPLYLSEGRGGEVQKGDASIAEYHDYCQLRDAGRTDEAARARRNLLDYNRVDCVSTLELRDWLVGLVDGDVGHRIATDEASEPEPEVEPEVADEVARLTAALRFRAGDLPRAERDAEQQAWAMLASALDHHRRERLPEAWAHFHRLGHPVDAWRGSADVVCFDEPPTVVSDWCQQPRKRTLSRELTALVHLPVGSTVGLGSGLVTLYADPMPQGLQPPQDGHHAVGFGCVVSELVPEGDRFRIVLTERLGKGMSGHTELPLALVPDYGVGTDSLATAIRDVAQQADDRGELFAQPALDLLVGRPPRLSPAAASPTSDPGRLPHTGDTAADLVEALLRLDHSYLAVQGPPGTGKTHTGSEVIRRLVGDHGWRVGVVAQSHAVVENFLAAVVRRGLDPATIAKQPKVGGAPGAHPWHEKQKAAAFVEEAVGGVLVGGTAWTFAGSGFGDQELDLLVVDEAGQFSLANTIAVSGAARRLLLLGDPQQLPQVTKGTHGEPVDRSALGWLMGDHASLPGDLGYFLSDTYRMHPAVCAPVSELSYDGLLRSAAPAALRSIDAVEPGLEVVRVAHHGNRTVSVEEAEVVVERITALVGTAHWHAPDEPDTPRVLDQGDVLVVAPYNAQRQLIERLLADAGLDRVRVGTVDKFQGQEAPVVFISMTASSAADVPRGMAFLLMRNRINVAVSRAQFRAVLVRSETLTSYLPTTTDGLVELGAFVRLCEG